MKLLANPILLFFIIIQPMKQKLYSQLKAFVSIMSLIQAVMQYYVP